MRAAGCGGGGTILRVCAQYRLSSCCEKTLQCFYVEDRKWHTSRHLPDVILHRSFTIPSNTLALHMAFEGEGLGMRPVNYLTMWFVQNVNWFKSYNYGVNGLKKRGFMTNEGGCKFCSPATFIAISVKTFGMSLSSMAKRWFVLLQFFF